MQSKVRGRPRLPDGEGRDYRVVVMVTEDERRRAQTAATRAGQSLSEYARAGLTWMLGMEGKPPPEMMGGTGVETGKVASKRSSAPVIVDVGALLAAEEAAVSPAAVVPVSRPATVRVPKPLASVCYKCRCLPGKRAYGCGCFCHAGEG